MSASRTKNMMAVTQRLVIFVAVALAAAAVLFSATYFYGERLLFSWLSFECGIIGGFVSIQQRLRKIRNAELSLLAQSWTMLLVIPIYGGIFALVIYILFLSGLIESALFPQFYIPEFHNPPTSADVISALRETSPKSGADLAKLMFWTFVVGFSERFVPQIIQSVTSAAPGASDGGETQEDGGKQEPGSDKSA